MYVDEFYIQHFIIPVPKSLVDLVRLSERLLNLFEDPFNNSTNAPEFTAGVYRALDGTKQQITNIYNELVDLELAFRTRFACIMQAVERELEPIVLDLKRQLVDSVTFISKNYANMPADSLLKDRFEEILNALLGDIQGCQLFFHIISTRERNSEPIPISHTADTPLETHLDKDTIRSARLLVLGMREENAELDSVLEVGSVSDSPADIIPSSDDELIGKTLDLLNLLETRAEFLSLRQGAWMAADLAFLLYKLEAGDEVVAMSEWAVYLFDKLDVGGSSIFTPYHVLARQNHARYTENDPRSKSDNMLRCVELNRGYQSKTYLSEFRHQLGRSLYISAAIAGRYRTSNESIVKEAVDIFRSLLQRESDVLPPCCCGHEDTAQVVRVSESQIDYPQVIFDFARALHKHAGLRGRSRNWPFVVELEKEAAEQIHKLDALYPDLCLDLYYEIYSQLSHYLVWTVISTEQRLMYQEKLSVHLRRRMQYSKIHSSALYNNLRQYAESLTDPGQSDAALNALREAASVSTVNVMEFSYASRAHSALADHFADLDYHEDSLYHRGLSVQYYRQDRHKKFSDYEARELLKAMTEYNKTGRFQEAIALGFQATYQCRRATNDRAYHPYLAQALALTACSLNAIKDHSLALVHVGQCLHVVEGWVIYPHSDVRIINSIENCLDVLHRSYDPISLKYSKECIHHLLRINTTYPHEVVVLHSRGCYKHTLKLYMHNKPEEALQWGESIIPWFEARVLGTDSHTTAVSYYIRIHYILSDICSSTGRVTRSVDLYEKSMKAERESPSMVFAPHFSYPSKLVDLGRVEDGLAAAERLLDYVRSNPNSEDINDLGRTLSEYAYALSASGRHGEAVAAAREAVREAEAFDLRNIDKASVIPVEIAHSHCRLAKILVDVGELTESLVHAQEAFDIIQDIKGGEGYQFSQSFAEWRRREICITLGLCLMANRMPGEALKLFEIETATPPENRPGLCGSYSVVLRLSAWCSCALGHHEEGLEKYAQLAKLQENLDPEILLTVQRVLNWEGHRPGQVALWKDLGLDCGHCIL